MSEEKEDKIKVKPRPTTRSGVPKMRTQVDWSGEEVKQEERKLPDEDRTSLVMEKHKNKYKRKQ